MTCYIEHIDFYLHYRSFCRSKRILTVTNETVNTMHRPQTEYVKIIAPDMKANGPKKNTLLSNKIQSRHENPWINRRKLKKSDKMFLPFNIGNDCKSQTFIG